MVNQNKQQEKKDEKVVEYKFGLDEMVATDLRGPGRISMLGFDDSGVVYFVKTKDGGTWFKEKFLTAR